MNRVEHRLEPLINVQQVISLLDEISLFGALEQGQQYDIFKKLQQVRYNAHEMIFKQGDQPSHIYIVLSGRVRLVFDAENHPLSKGEFPPGACFGETSVIGIQTHSASTIAVEDTELLVLSKEALMEIFDEDKELFARLMLNIAREASRRLHQTDELLLHYIHDHE
tara:strand:+ start:431 stop:928 length:498 start_codon:yes stop_codon:yes gene_type:complete